MMHVDAEDLALLALGEGSAQERAHVQQCPLCRREVESLAGVPRIMVDDGARPIRPPAHVWMAIESVIEQDAAEQPATASTGPRVVGGRSGRGASAPTERGTGDRGSTGSRKRRFSGLSLLGAAAAGAVLAWLGTILVDATQGTDEESVLASVQLEPLDDSVSPGAAQIVERNGQRVLQVEAGQLPEVSDGYLEVWLLQEDASGMVTIGLLDQGEQEFVLPDGLSTDTFGVIDVSVEHYDGDPSHSGQSLWRGPIAAP